MEKKECSKCLKLKNLSEYYFEKKRKKYKAQCKECRKIYINKNYNKEYTKEHNKKYQEENKENLSNIYKEKYKKNKDNILKKRKIFYKENKEKFKAAGIRRRAKKREINCNYSKDDILYTQELFKGQCFNCKSKENINIDHHNPLLLGFALSRNNAVLLCKSCNSSKGSKMPHYFYSTIQLNILEETYKIITEEI